MEQESLIGEIRDAMAAHDAWNLRLKTAINLGQCETDPDDLSCDDRCRFGQWLHGATLDARTRAGKPYQVTRRLHAEFHQTAGQVARLAVAGRKGEAYALMDGEYSHRSSQLLRALTKWRQEVSTM